jgi:hypothetical protein
MTNTVTPTWTDNVTVISDQVLARGSTLRATLDLRTKIGAYLFAAAGRGGTTALTNGVNVEVRRTLNNDGAIHPSSPASRLTGTTAASSTTVNVASNSGQAAVNVASSTGFAAGDLICIQDSGGGVTRLEWARVSKVAVGVITVDRTLQYTHTSGQADTVRNKADVFNPIWITGGATYEVVCDYGDDAAGDAITLRAIAQTYDSDTVT